MKAVVFKAAGPIDRPDSLIDITLDKPAPTGRDILVKINAVSVNPVDTKVRQRPLAADAEFGVLGYDAAGVVEAVGPDATYYKPGDAVFYAGSIARAGTNSEFHLVDERIVGRKPTTLTDAEAAALPLTAITAYEMLFDRLKVRDATPEGSNTILVIGGAGGVGSITIQLLRALTDMTVIATASRPETQAWVKDLGAHHVIDHREPIAPQVAALGLGAPGYVFSTTMTDAHFDDIIELIAPQGRFGLIDDPATLNAMPLKLKAISLHWEMMFTRSLFGTADMDAQRDLLNEVADLVDAGKLRTTVTDVAGKIDAETLKQVHALIESGTAKGKIVLEGF
ncbi:zinc-binding alcohol dehydrogenase family protein [Shimia sp. Alg240-R146]|uniref:zinc-binding alcohol dehydrogenase family protein n=1 Tax=Shimia sp. Alg240-R146 TaxID=2993449 RepID=UPI0022DEB88E|nr:zinc-binding alcohol dehydrogenase family protein [Shimia sp. Alg240-R146]